MEELQARHRKEQRDLQSQIAQKKKSASKKTRKGVNDECARLERELADRQELEVAELAGGTNGLLPAVPSTNGHEAPTDEDDDLLASLVSDTTLSSKNPELARTNDCLLYTSPSPRDGLLSRMPSSA